MYENVNFPGWEVVRKIGEGSFGGVYEIRRTLPDGRIEKAALKKLTVPKDNIEIRELYSQSFSRETITAHYKDQVRELAKEYTLTQELNSCKNVVACHDVQCVQHTDGIGWDIYIRMELLRPLKLVLSTDYQEMTVLKLGLSLCNALLACQEHHIVHRDIKPENILVSDRGEFKLGDFGIAKVSEKTATGTMTGTMGYMAPEVANRWHYGAQADIYSLGMVLYWMMNRRTLPFLPFPPTIPTAAQRQEAANRRFAGEDFPPPVNGSQGLKTIVMKACAFSTEERYKTVRELQRDLYACYQQRRARKNHDVSIPPNTDEAVWTNESTSGNTYSGSRIIHSNSQNEKTGTLNPDTRRTGTLKTDVTKTDTSKAGRSPTPPEKPKKRRVALICVLVALCLCFASITGYLLMYGIRLVRQSASAPETINRMRSDSFDEDTDDTDTLQVFHSGVLRKDVASITFLDTVADAPEDAWDISEDGDGSVLAWVTGEAPAYDLYIAGEGGVRAPEDCSFLFNGYEKAISITFGTVFDTSEVTSMWSMFAGCEKLADLDVHNFDTSHVTNMVGMFAACSELSNLDVSNFDTSLVTDMTAMFASCGRLTDLDLRSFDTSKVTNMGGMFSQCSELSSLDVTSFNTSLVTDMWEMFCGCSKLSSLNVSSFDTSLVYDMSYMFYGCDNLTVLDLSSFDFSNVESYDCFMDDYRLYNGRRWEELFKNDGYGRMRTDAGDAGSYAVDTPVFGENVKRGEIIKITFLDTLETAPRDAWDLSEHQDRSVLGWVTGTSDNYRLSIAGDGGVIAPQNCSNLFAYYCNLQSIEFNGCFDTSQVTDMSGMFYDCVYLQSLNLWDFDTAQVTDMSNMFCFCKSLTALNLSGFNTSNVTNMGGMFSDCYNLTSLDVSNFDTSQVTSMRGMFAYSSWENLNLSNFDTSNVTDMAFMFDGCGSLENVNVSNFSTSQVNAMFRMFTGCTSLTNLDLSSFNFSNVTDVREYGQFMDDGIFYNGRPWEELFQ